MKILYVTTIGMTMGFFKSFIRDLLDDGHVVDIATNESASGVPECYREWGCTIHQIATSRSPLNRGNITAIKQIKSLVCQEKYDIVHCHTPVAAMCTRLACRRLRDSGTKVIYTAHGFHFYKGAPKKNWLIYYPIEKICSKWTDTLITINKEDYALAQTNMKSKEVLYVPGVGIDVDKFANVAVDRVAKRQELGIPEDAFFLLSIGELNENKNHKTVLNAIARLENKNVYYAIAGKGALHDELLSLANELGLNERFKLLGFRSDVAELYKTADCLVHPSFREGLPVSIMEAMASGLPTIASNIRGCSDLIDAECGYLFDPYNIEDCERCLNSIMDEDLENKKNNNITKSKGYSNSSVNSLMKGIYGI